ncbi:hypothetical protein AMTRI_Chr05g71710 [Amborella trichopoda]
MYKFSKLIFNDLNTTLSNCPLITYSCLCNGTKLICKTFHRNTIQAQITIGNTSGQIAFFPRIPMQLLEYFRLPVQFKRKQFHFRPPFATIINKVLTHTRRYNSIFIKYFSYRSLFKVNTLGGRVCRSQRHHRPNIPKGEIVA